MNLVFGVKMATWQQLVPIYPGKVAITSFVVSWVSIAVLSTLSVQLVVLVEVCYLLFLLLLVFSLPIVKVVLCAHFLGTVFAVGMLSMSSGQTFSWFGFYAMAIAFFHFSEYVLTSMYNPHTLSIDSFLLNHSKEYVIAAMMSWVEYWLEYYFFPGFKTLSFMSALGAAFVVTGESLRKLSMITAGSNFNHLVQYRKRSSHELVTTGVYALFRHPSYVGWFVWSVGTQVLLCNPICLVMYAFASFVFFKERIYDEEESLILFFRDDYLDYKRKVWSGLPFISGYPLEEAHKLLKYS